MVISNWGEAIKVYGGYPTVFGPYQGLMDHYFGNDVEDDDQVPGQLTIDDELYGQADCD